MRHTAWLRLVFRVVGVVLVAFSLPGGVSLVVGLLVAAWNSVRADPLDTTASDALGAAGWNLLWSLGTLAELALGLYLFFNPKWLMKVCIDDITYRCPACRFDLRGLTAPPACPECGVRLPGDIPPPPMTPPEGSQNSPGPGMIPTSREQPAGPSA